MKQLERKLLRELLRMKSQMLAVAAVVACGISVFVSMSSVEYSLKATRSQYYSEYRFADIFMQAKRAPEAMLESVRRIKGVAAVRSRIVASVTLDVPGLNEPASGKLVSMPDRRRPVLNDVFLREGRYMEPGHPEEVIASETFMEANGLRLGDHVGAVINGRWKELVIVGKGLSPEYIYEVPPGAFFPDNRRFGVFWMSRDALESALDMAGAFNDLSITLAHRASEKDVIRRLDDMFSRYGSLGAYGRSEQLSDRFISDEIKQVGIQITVLPTIFLAVAVFLLNIVLKRLVSTQRDQIAVMKAMGYTNEEVGIHYLGFAMVPVLVGAVAGTALGAWLGLGLTGVYEDFYNFAELIYYFRFEDVALSVLLSAGAALVGALSAVSQAVALPPAEGMRPETPAVYKPGVLDRKQFQKKIPVSIRIIVRNLERRKLKAAISVLMIAFAVAILIAGRYSYDAVNHIMLVEFSEKHREDLTVIFNESRPSSVQYDIAALDGVLEQEFYRAESARLVHEHRSRRQSITGLKTVDGLRRLVDAHNRQLQLPENGLLLTTTLANVLGVSPGDTLTIEFLEGKRRTVRVPVGGTIDELLGLSAYIRIENLDRLTHDEDMVNAAYLRIDEVKAEKLFADFKEMPEVAGTSMLKAMQESFEELIAESMTTSTVILTTFASILAFAVVYNGARISLSERARELSSLRVLGLTRQEIAVILLGEQAILTIFAIPVGFLIGIGLSVLLALGLSSELYRMPVVFSSFNFVFALIVIVIVAILSGAMVHFRLNRLDMIAVLKTRE
ncbi:ABC transporter permease [Prosthecochloris sp. SCSIO W1101]|uniref:ABC transporter permease n=1 Tax=Prosthecochloris sp. SCSIO W1101 TaxID=2992242 RepID=UPI00223E4F37|nr:ABC transporter permease [Prosthecochloris sp. SCSIO W1101]UZJ42669.1 ABC transporter permease [Prosthecochloris sp. SCSIO W1101]